jgi:hypothetical protein
MDDATAVRLAAYWLDYEDRSIEADCLSGSREVGTPYNIHLLSRKVKRKYWIRR